MKAIHNYPSVQIPAGHVGNYKLKYNFESNSQPLSKTILIIYVGNYKLKYNFESNSQRTGGLVEVPNGWEL